MICRFSPHPFKSCRLISTVCNFWPQLQIFGGERVSGPPMTRASRAPAYSIQHMLPVYIKAVRQFWYLGHVDEPDTMCRRSVRMVRAHQWCGSNDERCLPVSVVDYFPETFAVAPSWARQDVATDRQDHCTAMHGPTKTCSRPDLLWYC